MSWPMPSITSSSAPGMTSAVRIRAAHVDQRVGVAVDHEVGTEIERSASERLPLAMVATSWRLCRSGSWARS